MCVLLSRQLRVVLGDCGGDLFSLFQKLTEIAGGLDVEPEFGALFEEFAEFKRHFGRDAAATEHDFVNASRTHAKSSCERVLGNTHGHEIIFE